MKILLQYWKLNFLSLVEYKLNFLFEVGAMLVNNILFISVWYMFFMKFGTIGGMEFGDFAILMSIMVIVFSYMHIFFANIHFIGSIVEEGKLDSHLLLPKNILVRLLSGKMMTGAFGDLIFGFMLMFFIPDLTMIMVFKILFLAILGSITFLGFMLIFVSQAFYMGSSRNLIRGVFEAILGPSHYPPAIFNGTVIKYLFMTIIPVYYVIFLPYELVISFNFKGFMILTISALFFLLLGILVFYSGLKRYESGNLMNNNV